MGIPGLLPLLKSITRAVHIREYCGQRVAVDAYSWLHKGALSCSKELVDGTRTDKYVQYCMHKVNLLLYHGVIPVLVFDGGLLPMKAGQEIKRQRSRKECLAKAVEHERSGNKRLAYECYQKAVDITPAIAFNLIQVLKEQNIEFIVAPYEADAQMAYLAINGLVHSVITEDSDMIPYACPRILYKMDRSGHGMEVEYNDLSKNKELNFTNFTEQQILQMCILSGCDYLPSIPGLGVKKAYALMRRLKCYKKVIKNLIFSGVSVVEGYLESFEKALLTFRHQRVFNPETQELVHLRPLESEHIDIDFVGPMLDADVARGIAHGDIDPLTKEFFKKEFHKPVEPPSCTPLLKPMPVGTKQLPSKRKTNLPLQKNDLSKYFVPVSAAAKRSFIPPRPTSSGVEAQEKEGSPSTPVVPPGQKRNFTKIIYDSCPPEQSSSTKYPVGTDSHYFTPSPDKETDYRTSRKLHASFDRTDSTDEAAEMSSLQNTGWDRPVKRCKSVHVASGKTSFDFFRLDSASVVDSMDSPLSLSPEWRDPFSQDSTISLSQNNANSPASAGFLEDLDLGEAPASEAVLKDLTNTLHGCDSPGRDVCKAGDDGDDEDDGSKDPIEASCEGTAEQSSCIISSLPALQSFSTDVSHVTEYRKIGHQALDAFETSVGLFKYAASSSVTTSLHTMEHNHAKSRHAFGKVQS